MKDGIKAPSKCMHHTLLYVWLLALYVHVVKWYQGLKEPPYRAG